MDFFTVPTVAFGVLYCLFVIGHDRRKILHFSVTPNPNALWVVENPPEAWAYRQPHRFSALTIRPRLKVRNGCNFGAETLGKPSNPNCFSQSVAERGRGALGRELPTRPPGRCDCLE